MRIQLGDGGELTFIAMRKDTGYCRDLTRDKLVRSVNSDIKNELWASYLAAVRDLDADRVEHIWELE